MITKDWVQYKYPEELYRLFDGTKEGRGNFVYLLLTFEGVRGSGSEDIFVGTLTRMGHILKLIERHCLRQCSSEEGASLAFIRQWFE